MDPILFIVCALVLTALVISSSSSSYILNSAPKHEDQDQTLVDICLEAEKWFVRNVHIDFGLDIEIEAENYDDKILVNMWNGDSLHQAFYNQDTKQFEEADVEL